MKLRAALAAAAVLAAGAPAGAAVLEVPAEHPTLQAAVDAAADGDVVRVAPGVYRENLVLAGKAVLLASHAAGPDDPRVARTVIDGGGGTAVRVEADAGPGTALRGFTVTGAEDGVSASGPLRLEASRVVGNTDGVDLEGGARAVIRDCLLADNADDGLDLDGDSSAVLEDNEIRDNGNDGIEIRFHPNPGPALEIVIRGNRIAGNAGDGIQLIGGEASGERTLRIERNLVADNARAGLGMMCCMRTVEDFSGAPLGERVLLVHNTFRGNHYGVSGGANLVAVNNVFADTERAALSRVRGDSIAAFNLFWSNGTDHVDSHVDPFSSLYADPGLDAAGRPAPRGPARDAGTPVFRWRGELLWHARPSDYQGPAPDLGAFETERAGASER